LKKLICINCINKNFKENIGLLPWTENDNTYWDSFGIIKSCPFTKDVYIALTHILDNADCPYRLEHVVSDYKEEEKM